ncbi:spt16 [Ecytonucleospora hepatopenaei]|uniref:FACT complex subunit n=1 Tax=Ecytonucleospora hepatopenaei TaxID=646526 RepID=A0A1W0E6W2_9MICR|nr:spt16 [Ecytonucleospora hepatopenaei]
MNNEVILDRELFYKRCKKLSGAFENPLLFMLGKRADVEDYCMNSAIFNYLLGFEFSETVIIIKDQPVFYTSPKKAMILEQLGTGVKIVRNTTKENPQSLNDFMSTLVETYGIVDKTNIKGEFCNKILSSTRYTDVTKDVFRLFSSKEAEELTSINKAAIVTNNLLKKAIDMCRDETFNKESMERLMNERIAGIEPAYIEFPDSYVYSTMGVRFSVRYKGYSVEIGRSFLCDVSAEYALQALIQKKLSGSILTEGKINSLEILEAAKNFFAEKGINKKIEMYTTGMLEKELSFEENFDINMNTVFVLKVGEYFANTFSGDKLLTLRDSAEMYSVAKMKFRNKTTEIETRNKLKEHQKELLDDLTAEMIKYYSNNEEVVETKENSKVSVYPDDASVPRNKKVVCDFENLYVIVPILCYAVPFHISNIKNVAVSASNKLRINLKESKEVREISGNAPFSTVLKSISVTLENADEILAQINDMKREYNKPKIEVKKQGELKTSPNPYKLNALLMKTDQKIASKKVTGNLELHENGFKYIDTHFLFSNIKSIFYQMGDFDVVSLVHFNFKEPILVNDKPTRNLQFHKKQGVNYHDTGRRENEHLALLRQQEEEDELYRVNRDFTAFIDRIENETSFRPQLLQKGFYGVYHKESTAISVTENSLVSVNETPFFILYLDDVEIVNFERVTYATKTFDCVFVFKDKKRAPKVIGSIETTKLNYMKTTLDSLNKVFMETKISINWNNLMITIMKDPLGFYNGGGWSELLIESPEEEISSQTASESSISSAESSTEEDSDMSTDESSESFSGESDETSSFAESDSSYESERPKKRKH